MSTKHYVPLVILWFNFSGAPRSLLETIFLKFLFTQGHDAQAATQNKNLK